MISYRSLIEVYTVGINPFGAPYLERVDPNVVRQRFCQHVLQFPVAPDGFLLAPVARENLGVEGVDAPGDRVQFLL